jgi:hypothetical protein
MQPIGARIAYIAEGAPCARPYRLTDITFRTRSLMTLVRAWADSPFARYAEEEPWALTAQSAEVVRSVLARLPREEYRLCDDIALHKTAIIEDGATLKGPLVLGLNGFVAAGAYLRGGNWIGANCIFGPGVELKSSFVFSGTKLAHFNFVGDSVLGENVNLEAGSIVCNYRNERAGHRSSRGCGCSRARRHRRTRADPARSFRTSGVPRSGGRPPNP